MIYEMRTYDLAPRSLAEVEKRFGEAYEHRKKYSELFAFWHTEIGPLNQIMHVWGYESLEERARIRGQAAKDPNWPPKIRDYVTAMKSESVVPFTFVPAARPGKVGPIFEIRYYALKPGPLPDTMAGWEKALPERTKLSPIVLAGGVEFGTNVETAPWAPPISIVRAYASPATRSTPGIARARRNASIAGQS